MKSIGLHRSKGSPIYNVYCENHEDYVHGVGWDTEKLQKYEINEEATLKN